MGLKAGLSVFVRLKLCLDIGRWFPEKSGELNSEFFISMNCSKNVAKDPKKFPL